MLEGRREARLYQRGRGQVMKKEGEGKEGGTEGGASAADER